MNTKPLRKRDLLFIGGWEGWVNQPYNDAVGFATIGYGHLLHRSRVTAGDRLRWGTISRARGLALLNHDAHTALTAVRQHVHVKINRNQVAALVSFIYNVGTGAFASSTLLRKLNAGDKRGAADELLKWDRAGGQRLVGLTHRRVAERALFRRWP